ncbi:MAG TPA: helix-turn-helix domain-containing protein [Terriglobales bacterium]|jgi:predicted transcriptional regulator|nr:helix-turn-helix domain-containing protein [Terriglobales bacterium]
MAIVDKLTPRQCMVIGEIVGHQGWLLRKEIAKRTRKDKKTIERILKSLPKGAVRKKRDVTLNGAPYRYKATLRKKSYHAFFEKWKNAKQKNIVPGTVPSGTP